MDNANTGIPTIGRHTKQNANLACIQEMSVHGTLKLIVTILPPPLISMDTYLEDSVVAGGNEVLAQLVWEFALGPGQDRVIGGRSIWLVLIVIIVHYRRL